MQNSLKKMLARMFADKKRQRRIIAVVCVLSVLVTTTVFTELMQPVITMTPDPVCGQAEHAHGADCFENQLACGAAESEEHAHGDDCYKNVLVCSKSEHDHTEKCYPKTVEEKKVTVDEPAEAPATEAPATEAPATKAPATEAPAIVSETEVTAEPTAEVTAEPTAEATAEVTAEPTAEATAEVTAEPTAEATAEPTAEPTAEVTAEPTAEVTAEVTAEPTAEATAEPTAEATVVPAAPTVAVTAAGAEKVFVGQTVTWTIEASGEAELTYSIVDESGEKISSGVLDAEASHVSWLADRAGVFTLTVTAANESGSVSADGSVTVEASEALIAAVRSDAPSCFAEEKITFHFAYSGGVEPAAVSITVDQDGEVLAELSEFAETVEVTPADLGEKVTTVTASITVTDSIGSTVTGVCEIPCAVRTRESASYWEKSTRTDLTGEWPEDLIAVAETQLGYKESEINFIVDDEGERQGYTRYGQWYGSHYAEWCGMFVSFNLNYAGIPERYFPREANCEKWIAALKPCGLYESADGGYEPEAGDLVFFDWEDDGESDHVGIVTRVTDKKIETIEGNTGKGVRRREYSRGDKVLYGYGCILEAYENYLRDKLDLDLEAGVGAQAIVTAETANLRAGADSDSELIAQLAIDTVVDVLAAEQNRAEIWYQVTAGEHAGYIRSDLVETDYIAVEELIPAVADYDSLMNRIAELPFDGSEAHALAAAGIADEADFAYESGMLTDEQYAEIIAALTAGSIMTLEENSEDMALEADGKITVTFEIDNTAYINDNGNTHVRIESEELYRLFSANGMTTAAEAWDGQPGWYKVTSTGILVKYEIDAGSTLSAAGYATPDVEIYNPSNVELSSTYVSSYSWVSRDEENNATVCGADTAFEADTTLYLQLYSNSIYYLDYVCCENCNQSISFATGALYAHPSIQLGNTVDDQYIPKAAAVNSAFECDSSVCASSCRSSTNDKVFDHWYLKNTAGEIVEFDSTVRITADYLNSDDYDDNTIKVYTIKVYAAWTDAPEMVTNLTFMDSDYTTLGTVDEVAYGTTIDKLIDSNLVAAPALTADDCEFIGWTFGDGSAIVDGAHKVTASDTAYRAVYKAKVYVKIPDVENGDLNTYATSEYTVQTGQNLLTAVDADGNSISAILERESVTNGYMFGGWTLEQGSERDASVIDLTNTTAIAVVNLTAEYSKAVTITFRYLPDGETEYVVVETYYVKNGGTINDMVDGNGNSVTVDSVSIPGYTVNRWSNANGMPSYAYGPSMQIDADIVFTATVTALSTHTVTFQYLTEGDGISGMTTAATYRTTASGTTLRDIIAANTGVEATAVQLPECPLTMDARYFSHWATADGTVATLDTSITADTTFEAVFADKAHVKFQYSYKDAESGADVTGTAGESYVIPGKPLSDSMTGLPVVEIPGRRFCGWILTDGGVQTEINLATVVPEDATEMIFTAVLKDEISISFGYQDAMDSDNDGDTDEFISTAIYTVLLNQQATEAQRVVVDQDGNETIEKLTRIPDAPILENYTFTGWYYTIGGTAAELTDLSALDSLSEDVTVVANYEKSTGCTVTFHDIDPDGSEKQPGMTIDTLVPAGEALADYLSGVSLKDRTADEVIKWYTIDADGVKTEYDPTQPVTTDLELYTYTYRIVLTLADADEAKQTASLLDVLMPRAYAANVEVSKDGYTLTIVAADGYELKAADFVIDGVDYSLYTISGNDTVADLIGMTVNSDLPKNYTIAAPSNQTMRYVNFYVFVNGEIESVYSANTSLYSYYTSKEINRWGLTAQLLESIYGNYGFKASSVSSGVLSKFAQTDAYNSAIYLDDYAGTSGTAVLIPTLNQTDLRNIDVYYLPNETGVINGNYYWNYSENNMFYSIEVDDDGKLVYSADDLPATQYVLTGENAEFTLSTELRQPVEGMTVEWKVYDASGKPVSEITPTDNGDDTVTFSFTSVDQQYVIKPTSTVNLPDGAYTISYNVGVVGEPTGTVPTIEGQAEWTDIIMPAEDGTYIVRTPNPAVYTTEGSGAVVVNNFLGWAVNGDTTEANLLAAGTVLTAEEIVRYAGESGAISLTGQWRNEGPGGSVSFYVNLELQVADYSGSTQDTPATNYTRALYGTGLTVDPDPGYYSQQNIIQGNSTAATAATDAAIRQLINGVEAEYMNENRTFTLDSFPDDERILAQVRKTQAEYIAAFENSGYQDSSDPTNVTNYRAQTEYQNGKLVPKYRIISEEVNGEKHYIPVDELTSANYTVRWYVFKYEDADSGWHIDGVLVKREGQLAITKTFYGYDTSVEAVKQNYSISVKNSAGSELYRLNLNPKSSSNQNGYVAYDSDSDTYTWAISLTQGATYTLVENDYVASQVQLADADTGDSVTVTIASLAEYMVTSLTAGETVVRQSYPQEGIQVVARAYETDLNYTNYKTVKFYNSYIPTNSMLLSKVDDNGAPLENTKFQLKKAGEVVRIWKDQDGYYYIFDPNTNDGIEAEQTQNNLITTDAQGFATIIGLKDVQYGGEYELIEVEAPSGYTPIQESVTFEVDGSTGAITLEEHLYAELINGMNIKVTNTSETIPVTVVKDWTDDTDKEVTVALCMDGTPMAAYTVVLNAGNNWTHTWNGIPAYVGGELANYTIREMWIGDSAYSGTIDDGYDDYIVTYANPIYTYDDKGKPTTLTLRVYNRSYTGGVEFTKVDENGQPLPGAIFAVYSLYVDEQCQNQYGSSQQSDEDGKVDFGALAAGTYYMKETAAPDGYVTDTAVYKVVVSGSGTTISRIDDPANTSVISINNYPSSADITVKKVDSSGKSLSGATFQIKKDSQPYLYDGTSSTFAAYPSTTLSDLPAGTYTITETQAPTGYYGMSDAISFTITDGKVVIEETDGVDVESTGNAEGNNWIYTASTSTFTVTNMPGVELPSTGGAGTLPYTIGGLLLMAASLLYGFGQRRKGERGDAV